MLDNTAKSFKINNNNKPIKSFTMVFAIYKRNKGNSSDTLVSYSSSQEEAESIIPPINKDNYYVQELPYLNKQEDKVKEATAKLWTRDDAADFQKKSVVSNPMFHRNNKPTVYPSSVNYYIENYNRVGSEDINCPIFNCDDNLVQTDIVLKKVPRSEDANKYVYKREPIKLEPIEPIEPIKPLRPIIPKPEYIDISKVTVKSKTSDYTKYIKKTEPITLDGTHIFYFQYKYCYPDMSPVKDYIYDSSATEESEEAVFKPGWFRADRDFYLCCYSRTKEKAETLIKEKLKALLKEGTLRK